MADKSLYRDQCLIPNVRVLMRHKLHNAGLCAEVGEHPSEQQSVNEPIYRIHRNRKMHILLAPFVVLDVLPDVVRRDCKHDCVVRVFEEGYEELELLVVLVVQLRGILFPEQLGFVHGRPR